LSPFFHCSTGDIFGYNVIEPFGAILFRTGDIVALSTVGSEMTPICKATVNDKSQGSTAKHLSLGEAGRKSLPKTVVSSDSVTVFKYRLKTFSSPWLSSFFLSKTLPGLSDSEVTTLWRYTNTFIIIILKTLSTKFSRVKY